MKNKILKTLKIGTLSSGLIVAIPFVTSVSANVLPSMNPNQTIQVKINGKTLYFMNSLEARNYVLRNNLTNTTQEVMVGNRRYLDRNSGMLDTNELYKYTADKDHISPAYKKINGEYTRNKKEAFNSLVGRRNIVSQYSDLYGGLYEGNIAGLTAAKESILRRQISNITPIYNVKLNEGDENSAINFNPFNKSDQDFFKKKVFDIYNKNKNTKGAKNPNVTATYMFPKADVNGYAGVEPSSYKDGLTLKDIAKNQNKDETILKKYIKENIRYRMTVTLPDGFHFSSSDHSWSFMYDSSWGDRNQTHATIKFTKNIIGQGGTSLAPREMTIDGMDLNFMENHKEDLRIFFGRQEFWHKGFSPPGEQATSAKSRRKMFGIPRLNILGDGKKILNDNRGSYTQATIEGYVPSVKKVDFYAKINELVKPELKNTCFIKFYSNIIHGLFNKSWESPVSKLVTPLTSTEENLYFSHENLFDKSGYEELKKINPLGEPADLLKKYISQEKNLKKILLFNGTPILELDATKDGTKEGIKLNDADVISKIHPTLTTNKQLFNYEYKTNDIKYWDTLTKQSENKPEFNKASIKDFRKSYNFNGNAPKVESSLFAMISNNDDYKTLKPILLYDQGNTTGIKPFELRKVLSEDEKKVEEVHKIDGTLLFKNNSDMITRKKQVASKYFEPPLVYVIYDKNDKVIETFFDDKETIKHNARATLSKFLRKDVSKVYVKIRGEWSNKPFNNEKIIVYKIKWAGNEYFFESFENIQNFIQTWIETNAKTVLEGGMYD